MRRCGAPRGTAGTAPSRLYTYAVAPAEVELEAPEQRPHDHALQAVGAAGEPVEACWPALAGSSATPSVTISRVRSVPRRTSALVTRPSTPAASVPTASPTQRVGHHVLGEQRRGVGADAEERRVAERHDAGVTQDQIERHREQREDRDLVDSSAWLVPREQRNSAAPSASSQTHASRQRAPARRVREAADVGVELRAEPRSAASRSRLPAREQALRPPIRIAIIRQ